jgi:hypothetical protein
MWCTECGKECEHYAEDIGIGFYEFWGRPCNDVCWVNLSQCCDAEVADVPPINWCPICEDVDLDKAAPFTALSRKNNQPICADCGTAEALADIDTTGRGMDQYGSID